MSILTKIVIILGLIYLIAGQFTKSKAVRQERRTRTTHILLGVLIGLMLISVVMQLWK